MTAPDVDLLMIGHFAVDRLIVDGLGETSSGGAVYYGGVALCRLGRRVAVATRLGRADLGRLAELEDAGARVFVTPTDESSGIANSYQSTDMERRITAPLGFARPFEPGDIPDLTAAIYAVVPIIAGEVDLALLQRIAARGPVALDIQGFVRVRDGDALVFKPWSDIAAGLACVTFLKVDRAEAELLTGETNLDRAARRLAELGPREVVLTESAGVTVFAEGNIHHAPFTPRSLTGRTGRGDTCFATYLGKRLDCSAAEACRWAGAVTTLKQERPGPWSGNLTEVEALLAARSALPSGKN